MRSIMTAVPTVKNVKRPTILHEMVAPRLAPVTLSQIHHRRENSLRIKLVSNLKAWVLVRDKLSCLYETDVCRDGGECKEDERGVEEDEASLDDMSVV